MAEIATIAISAFDSLLSALTEWRARRKQTGEEAGKKSEAIEQIRLAVIETRAYLYDSATLGREDRNRERQLALRWQKAGKIIRNYDRNLWEVAQLKALGWSDPSGWAQVGDKVDAIKLEKILEQCRWLQDES